MYHVIHLTQAETCLLTPGMGRLRDRLQRRADRESGARGGKARMPERHPCLVPEVVQDPEDREAAVSERRYRGLPGRFACFCLFRVRRRISLVPHFLPPRPSPGFNPRSRRGSDTSLHADVVYDDDVSIHAPAGGATASAGLRRVRAACFDPRSRRGSDFGGIRSFPERYVFRSTLPQEERPCRGPSCHPYM